MVVGQKGGGLGDDEANCRVSSLCREAARALESWLFSHGGQAKPRLRLKPLAAVLSRSNGIRDAVQGAVFTATSLKLSGNAKYKLGHYEEASTDYAEGVEELSAATSGRLEIYCRGDGRIGLTGGGKLLIDLLNNQAACHAGLRNHRQVISVTTDALALVPTDLKALLRRAFALEAIERYQPALADFMTVLRIAPRSKDAAKGVGRLRRWHETHQQLQSQELAQGLLARQHMQSEGSAGAAKVRSNVRTRPGIATSSPDDTDNGEQRRNVTELMLRHEENVWAHCDEDIVGIHCVASAVIFLQGRTDQDLARVSSAVGVSGEMCFADADCDRLVAAVEGRLVGWTSGPENCHRLAAICDGCQVTLSIWFGVEDVANNVGGKL